MATFSVIALSVNPRPIITYLEYLSRLVKKTTICLCENKDADQLHDNRKADHRLSFRCTDSTLPLVLTSEISSFLPASVTVQSDFRQTCSETALLVFSRDAHFMPLVDNVPFLMQIENIKFPLGRLITRG